jgi:HEAT repeat protein
MYTLLYEDKFAWRQLMISHSNRPPASNKTIKELIDLLGSKDPMERNHAQYHLIEIGKPAVAALIILTAQPETELRREAASILGDIHDPSTIPTLIDLLVDRAFEVRWRAAESLIKMKRDSVVPLLQELQRKNRIKSVWFLEGAHHILRKLDAEGYLGLPLQKVLEAFNDSVKEIAVPEAAEKAMEALKNRPLAP